MITRTKGMVCNMCFWEGNTKKRVDGKNRKVKARVKSVNNGARESVVPIARRKEGILKRS